MTYHYEITIEERPGWAMSDRLWTHRTWRVSASRGGIRHTATGVFLPFALWKALRPHLIA